MQGKHPLYARVAVDTKTICRIETVFQLTQRLLQQQGERNEVAKGGVHSDTNEQSSAEVDAGQVLVVDASEDVCQQQHEYVMEDEELDPMGWGFSIDQP